MNNEKQKYYWINICVKYCLPIIIFLPLLILLICVFLASRGFWGDLPNFQALENPETNLATEV